MADIIRKKKTDVDDKKDQKEIEKDKVDDLVVHADTVVPSLISKLVSGQLKKITASDSKQVERKSSRSPRRRRSRSRSRSRSRERYHFYLLKICSILVVDVQEVEKDGANVTDHVVLDEEVLHMKNIVRIEEANDVGVDLIFPIL